MKIEWNRRYTTIAIYALLVVAGSALFYSMLQNVSAVGDMISNVMITMRPFIYGFVIAYIINPIFVFSENKLLPTLFGDKLTVSGRKGLSIIITYAFSIICLVVFFSIVIPQIVLSIGSIIGNMQEYITALTNIVNWLVELISVEGMPQDFYNALNMSFDGIVAKAYEFVSATLPKMLDFAMNFTNAVVNTVVGIIISIYMFIGKERFMAQLKKVMYALFPKDNADFAIDLAHESNAIFSGFISGKILDSIIIGILCFAGLYVMQMPYAMLISVIVGVTNVIPYFGPFFGAIPSFFIVLTESPAKSLIFLLFIFFLQQFDGNILGPKILGDSTGLSAFWVIFSIMFFGKFMGFTGMFIGVPVFAVIYSVIKKYITMRLTKKGLSADTKDYASTPEKLT